MVFSYVCQAVQKNTTFFNRRFPLSQSQIITSMNRFLKGFYALLLLFSVFGHTSLAQFSNGRLDLSFDPGTGANNYVYSVVPVTGGKVMIGGLFTSYNGTAKGGICRLNSNGSLDGTFGGTGIGSGQRVYFIHPMAGNRFLIAGNFTQYNGVAKNRIVKITSTGAIDNSFNPGTGANGDIYMISPQADGKLILSGNFTTYNGIARNRIVRINANGSLDASFDPGTGANTQVLVAKVQTDGKILVGGNFTSFNGVARNRITRLNEDGSLDPTFNVGSGCNGFVTAFAIQNDGQILLGGSFTGYNNVWRSNIARINTDGSLDESLVSIPGANYILDYIIPLSNGKIMAAGQFTSYNGVAKNGVIRLQANGDLDTTFNPGGSMQTGSNNSSYLSLVYCMALGTGGDLWLAGNFTNYNGVSRNRIAHLAVVPHTQLTATYCNTTQQLNTNLACTAVSGATQYEWEVTDQETNTVYLDTTATNRFRLNLLSQTTYNKTYSIRVRAFVEEWGEFGNACTVATPPIPVSGLIASQCGITQTGLSQTLTPITVVNATQYEWEITDVGTNEVTTVLVTKTLNLNTAGITGYGYNKTYSIRIRAFIGGSGTFGPFGSACTVTTPSIPASGLIASQCGITQSGLSQTLSPITVLNATQYEWEITDVATNLVTTRLVTRTLNLNTASISGYGYNKSYSIRVRAFAGAFGPFGSACTVSTPPIPASGLIASQCGITMTSLTQTLTPITVLSATQYEWEITDVETNLITTATVARTLKLSAAGISGYGNAKTYSIRIRAFAGAFGPFGSACLVNTPPAPGLVVQPTEIARQALIKETSDAETLSVFPNPNAGMFKVRGNAGGEIRVLDLMGKELIRTPLEEVEKTIDIRTYPAGIYLIKTEKETVRVVKW